MTSTLSWDKEVVIRHLKRFSFAYEARAGRFLRDILGYRENGNGNTFKRTTYEELSDALAKAQLNVLVRRVRAAKSRDELAWLLTSTFGPTLARSFRQNNGRFDWNKYVATNEETRAGRVIARHATRAFLSPHTRMGQRRLRREFDMLHK